MYSLWQAAARFYASSIGKKILVALTGLALMGFLVGHLVGNLLIFKGPETINDYAHGLTSLGPVLWVVRLGLIGMVVLHIVATVHLTVQNRLARPEDYQFEATLRATRASRTMIWSGLTIAAFVIYHLMHFTWGTFNHYRDPNGPYFLENGHQNTYKMVIDGFNFWPNSAFYLVAMGLLCAHLSHGVASLFQTLGVTTPSSRPLITAAGWAFAAIIFIGFSSIPVCILAGFVN